MIRCLCFCVCCCLVACSDDDKKKIGDPCENNADCMDEICHVGVCYSKDPKKSGEPCTLDAECRSFNCQGGLCAAGRGAVGDPCRFNVECASGVCRVEGSPPGLCVAESTPDGGADMGVDVTPLDAALDLPPPDAPLPDQLVSDQLVSDQLVSDLGPCGGKNQPCCGSLCTSPMACISNLCVCGGKSEPCCTGDLCESNLSCTTGKTCACGGLSQACCGGTTCTGTLFCAGEACTCIKQLDGDTWLRTDGTVWAQTGISTSLPITAAGPPLKGITHIAAGEFHGCGRKSDGTVWCWGRTGNSNAGGQLGNGALGGSTTAWSATQVTQAPSGMLTGVASLSGAGSGIFLNETTCAVKTNGTLWCWGRSRADSNSGLFQQVAGPDKPRATQIMTSATTPMTNVKQVSVKNRHACAVVGTSAACWGINSYGQLGAGDTSAHLYPVLVTISGKLVKKVSVGHDLSCALTTTGEVYCWGINGNGDCGVGYTSTAVTGPVQVVQSGGGNLTGVADIAAGFTRGCAVKTNSSLWCWGGGVNKATKQLDKSSKSIDDVALLTMDASNPYRIVKTNGEYWQGKDWKQSYSCP